MPCLACVELARMVGERVEKTSAKHAAVAVRVGRSLSGADGFQEGANVAVIETDPQFVARHFFCCALGLMAWCPAVTAEARKTPDTTQNTPMRKIRRVQ